jgi:hypothetical protein
MQYHGTIHFGDAVPCLQHISQFIIAFGEAELHVMAYWGTTLSPHCKRFVISWHSLL